jgi:hypothetical protein
VVALVEPVLFLCPNPLHAIPMNCSYIIVVTSGANIKARMGVPLRAAPS